MDFSAATLRIILFCCGLLVPYWSRAEPVSAASGKRWVVCVSGSDEYAYTYGFEAGIYKLCHELIGENKENLIIISPDTAAYHVKNSIPGQVVHGEGELTDKSINVYRDVNVTYKSEDMTTNLFYEILRGNKTAVKGIGGEKVLESGPEDTVILVFINFGDYGLLSLTNDQDLNAEELVPFVEDLKDDNKFKKMLILAEGSNPGSLFNDYLCTDCNIIAMTNDGRDGLMDLCFYNYDVKAFTSTCYMYHLMEQLKTVRSISEKSKDSKKYTLFDLFVDVRMRTALKFPFTTNLYGDLDMGNLELSEFFTHPHS